MPTPNYSHSSEVKKSPFRVSPEAIAALSPIEKALVDVMIEEGILVVEEG